jgi:hypothetical protein
MRGSIAIRCNPKKDKGVARSLKNQGTAPIRQRVGDWVQAGGESKSSRKALMALSMN